MTQQIEAPNGDIIEFPDNMSDAQITAVMRREYPTPAPTRQQRMQSLTPQQRATVARQAMARQTARLATPMGAAIAPIADTLSDPSRRDQLGRDIGGAVQSVANYWSHPPTLGQWWDQTTRGIGEGLAQVPATVANVLTHPAETIRNMTYGPFADEEIAQQQIDAARAQGDVAALPQLAARANAHAGAAAINAGGALIPGSQALRPAAGLRGLIANAGRTARIGALYGGATGYLTTPGGPEERAAGGAAGAGTGGTLGLVAPMAVSGVGAVMRRGVVPLARAAGETLGRVTVDPNAVGMSGGNIRMRPPPERPPQLIPGVARRTIRAIADRAGLTPAQVEERLAAARSNPQGQVLADVLGDPGARTTASIAQSPGRTGQLAADVLETRARSQPDVIANKIRGENGGFGVGSQSTTSALSDLDAAEQTVFNDFNTLWRTTTPEQNAIAHGIYERELAPLLETNTDLLRGPMRRAQRVYRQRTNGASVDDNVGMFMHILKREIDADAYAAGVARQTETAGSLRVIRDRINQTLEGSADRAGGPPRQAMAPGYRQTVAAEQSIIKARNAVENGRRWLNEDHNRIRAELQGMSEAERYYARVGLAEEITSRTAGAEGRAINVAQRLSDNNLRHRIAAAFDNPEQAADFLDNVLRTQQQLMKNAIRWNTGSQTWSNASHGADNILQSAADIGVDVASGRPASAAARATRGLVNHTVGRVVEHGNNQRGAALLTRVDTADSEAFANEVIDLLREREGLRRTNAAVSGTVARAGGGAAGRRRQ